VLKKFCVKKNLFQTTHTRLAPSYVGRQFDVGNFAQPVGQYSWVSISPTSMSLADNIHTQLNRCFVSNGVSVTSSHYKHIELGCPDESFVNLSIFIQIFHQQSKMYTICMDTKPVCKNRRTGFGHKFSFLQSPL